MRGALSGLTVRGRSLIAAGLACLVCAVALGELDLVRIGVLVLVLPLAATTVLVGTRLQLECSRSISPRRVAAGTSVVVTARLANVGRRPTPALVAEDVVGPADLPDGSDAPPELGAGSAWSSSPRFALDRLEPGTEQTLTYSVQPPRRGVYECGPLTVRSCDPFGFCELPRTFAGGDRLLVTPQIVPMPRLDPSGRWSAGASGSGTGVGHGGDDEIGTRPYRLGDELRRVHWRTTARVGELSVRREEQRRQGSVTLVLDVRPSAWVGAGQGREAFELAVSVVASLSVALAEGGTGMRLVTLEGTELAALPTGRWAGGGGSALVLERLATVQPGYGAGAGAGAGAGTVAGGPAVLGVPSSGDLPVAVFGRFGPSDARLLGRVAAAPGIALVVGPDADPRPLAAAGWRTAVVPDLAMLPLAWQHTVGGGFGSSLGGAGGSAAGPGRAVPYGPGSRA